jgi:hypothetical protein
MARVSSFDPLSTITVSHGCRQRILATAARQVCSCRARLRVQMTSDTAGSDAGNCGIAGQPV